MLNPFNGFTMQAQLLLMRMKMVQPLMQTQMKTPM